MGDHAPLFTLAGEHDVPAPLIIWRDKPGAGFSARTAAWRRNAEARVATMHRRYGTTDGETCEGCRHLTSQHHAAGSFRKCEQAHVSRSDATDWRGWWPACGAKEAQAR